MFLDRFEEYCKVTIPRIYKNNKFAARVLGCMVLNTAARAYAYFSQSLPGNMFIALIGEPGGGKTRLMDCAEAAVLGTHVSVLGPATPEALLESLARERQAILFWDEFGEVVKKAKGDYMSTFSEKMNKAYYLKDLGMRRTSKPSITLSMRSYYLSAVVTCVPEQWKEAETQFYGGFERRWLPLRIGGELPLFDFGSVNPEGAEILAELHSILSQLKGVAVAVDGLSSLGKYEQEIKKRVPDREKQIAIAEYLTKIVTAELVNLALEEIVSQMSQVSQASHKSHGHMKTSQTIFVTFCDYICDNMGRIVTCDGDKNSVSYVSVSSQDDVERIVTELVLKYDILDNLIRNVAGWQPVEEAEMEMLVRRVMKARMEKKAMPMRDFVREILGTRNASWYRPRIEALAEAEVIRIVEHMKKKIVILDPEAKICGNCAKWDGLPCDASRISAEAKAEAGIYSPLDECRYPERFEKR